MCVWVGFCGLESSMGARRDNLSRCQPHGIQLGTDLRPTLVESPFSLHEMRGQSWQRARFVITITRRHLPPPSMEKSILSTHSSALSMHWRQLADTAAVGSSVMASKTEIRCSAAVTARRWPERKVSRRHSSGLPVAGQPPNGCIPARDAME